MRLWVSGQECLVCWCKKSWYSLKSTRRQWYRIFDDLIQSIGFYKGGEDHHLFSKRGRDRSPIFLILYVDDMLLSDHNIEELVELQLKFTIKNLGPAWHILGTKISWLHNQRQLFLSQGDYIRRVLERFNMQSAKSASTALLISLRLSKWDCLASSQKGEDMKSVSYAPAVSSWMHVTLTTRPT